MTTLTLAPGAAAPAAFLTATRLMLVRKLRETLRQPAWLASGLVTPLLYLALFAPLLDPLSGGLAAVPGFEGGDVVDGFMPGMLVLFALGSGILVPSLLVVAIAAPVGFDIHPRGLAVRVEARIGTTSWRTPDRDVRLTSRRHLG